MKFKSKQSLKEILTLHELAFIILIIIAVTVGAIGLQFWQSLSQETQRISALVNEVQQTRGDLYRQMKELFDAVFLDDTGAKAEYNQFTQSVEQHFKKLNNMASGDDEKDAIQALHQHYKRFVAETSVLFDKKTQLLNENNRLDVQHALNNGIEKGLFSGYELILARTETLLLNQQNVLDQRFMRFKHTAILLLLIPVFLSILLFIFSRIFLQKNIVNPIKGILKATAEISAGNLSFKAPETGAVELVNVASAINLMAEKLALIQETLVKTEKQAAQGLLVPMLAHNIRNPLASIRATAQVLESPELDQDTRESLIGIISTVDRLERWTGALLAYLHPLKPQHELANIQTIIAGACAPLQQKLQEKSITLIMPKDRNIKLMTDVHLLEQVIYNFVLNAVEASKKDASIEITLFKKANKLDLKILDHGCGMPFTPDAKETNAPTTKRFGTGLGIPFGFKVCEALNCTLSFNARPTGGTCVTIGMPTINPIQE